jgi:hypothetical protein
LNLFKEYDSSSEGHSITIKKIDPIPFWE